MKDSFSLPFRMGLKEENRKKMIFLFEWVTESQRCSDESAAVLILKLHVGDINNEQNTPCNITKYGEQIILSVQPLIKHAQKIKRNLFPHGKFSFI